MTDTEPKSLEELLDEIEKALEEAEDSKASAESSVGTGKTRLAAVTGFAEDAKKLTSAYQEAYKNLVAQQDAYEKYLGRETACLEQILGVEAQTAKDEVNKLHKQVHEARKAVGIAKADLETRQGELDEAKKARDDAKASAERWQKLVATMTDRFKALDGLKGEVNAAHEATKYAVAYWLLALPEYEPEPEEKKEEAASAGGAGAGSGAEGQAGSAGGAGAASGAEGQAGGAGAGSGAEGQAGSAGGSGAGSGAKEKGENGELQPPAGRFQNLLTPEGGPTLVSSDELQAKLLEQAKALDAAEKAFGTASLAVEMQKEDLVEAEADLADREKNLDAQIREALEKIKPPEPTPAAKPAS